MFHSAVIIVMGVSSPKIIRIMRVIKSWLFFHALQCPHDVLYLLICYTPLPLKQNWEVVWCKFYPIITDQLKLSQSGKNGLVQVSYVTKLFILHSQLKVMALHILLQQQIITDFSQEKIPLSFTKIYTYMCRFCCRLPWREVLISSLKCVQIQVLAKTSIFLCRWHGPYQSFKSVRGVGAQCKAQCILQFSWKHRNGLALHIWKN